MRVPLTQGWQLIKQALKAWSDDYAPSMGAAIAYYTLFSIAPLLLIVISVAGFVFGDEAVRGELTGGLQFLMGEEGAKAVEGLLASVSEPKEGIIATVIGVFVLLLGATTVFGELQNALDRIWRAPAREDVSGLWRLLRSRLLSLGMILGIAFLLMVSLIFDMVLQGLGKIWGTGPLEAFAQALNLAIGFGLTTTIFALIYKLMPRAKIEWHDVWVGAAVTALLFTLGKFLISVYIGRSAVASSFGAAGSLVVVMIWVYYSAQIFLLGAEFTWVYAHSYGSRRGEKRPGAPVDAMDEPKPVPATAPAALPVRLAPAPMPALHMSEAEVPVLKRKPLYTFGAAAALGLLAGFLLRAETFVAKPKPRWRFRYAPRMFAGRKVVVAVLALAIAGGTGYYLYAAKQKREQQRRVAELLADTTTLLRKALSAPPAPEALGRIEGNLKAAKGPGDRELAAAAEDYIHGAREIVRHRGEAERLTREAAMSRRALSMHMGAAAGRDTYWIRVATDLKKRVERDHFELDTSLKAISSLLFTLPESRKRLEPLVDATLLLEESERRAARERVEHNAKRAHDELEKVRRLAMPR